MKKKKLIVTSWGERRREGRDRDMGFRDTICFVGKKKIPTGIYFPEQGNIFTILQYF